jgi:hypothetical protein
VINTELNLITTSPIESFPGIAAYTTSLVLSEFTSEGVCELDTLLDLITIREHLSSLKSLRNDIAKTLSENVI